MCRWSLRPRRPNSRARWRLLLRQDDVAEDQLVDLQLADARLVEREPPDREEANAERADRQRPERGRAHRRQDHGLGLSRREWVTAPRGVPLNQIARAFVGGKLDLGQAHRALLRY